MTFFNPAQMQSTMNSPLYAQMLQQLQGSGSLSQPGAGGTMQNMAPQIPMAQPQQGAGRAPMAGQPAPAAQMNPTQALSGLTGLGSAGVGAFNGLGSIIGTTAGSTLGGGVAGATQGSGLLGAATGGATGVPWLDSLLGFL